MGRGREGYEEDGEKGKGMVPGRYGEQLGFPTIPDNIAITIIPAVSSMDVGLGLGNSSKAIRLLFLIFGTRDIEGMGDQLIHQVKIAESGSMKVGYGGGARVPQRVKYSYRVYLRIPKVSGYLGAFSVVVGNLKPEPVMAL